MMTTRMIAAQVAALMLAGALGWALGHTQGETALRLERARSRAALARQAASERRRVISNIQGDLEAREVLLLAATLDWAAEANSANYHGPSLARALRDQWEMPIFSEFIRRLKANERRAF